MQLELPFDTTPKKPKVYVILGQWGLCHMARRHVTLKYPAWYRDAPLRRCEASTHREPTFSSRWMPPADSDE